MQRIHAVGLLAAAALICSACTPAVVETPTPTPVATLQCHGEFTEEPHPCDQAEYDAMAARDAEYDEAEATYRRAVELLYALRERREPITEELRGLLTGEYLASVESELAQAGASEVSFAGQPNVVWVKRLDLVDQGSILALEVCTAPGSLVVTSGGQPGTVPTLNQQLFFRSIDNQPKLSSNRVAVVKSCDS